MKRYNQEHNKTRRQRAAWKRCGKGYSLNTRVKFGHDFEDRDNCRSCGCPKSEAVSS